MSETVTQQPAEPEPAPASRRARLRPLLLDGAHLAVLSAFAIGEPLFSVLSKNAEFFAARGSRPIDIVSFALAVTLLPPALLLLIEALVGLVSTRARRVVHAGFVALLLAIFLAQALKKQSGVSPGVLLAISAAIAIGFAVLYARAAAARSFLTVLSPAPLLFLALFLVFSPVAKLVLPKTATAQAATVNTRTPIVMLVMDEFPLTDLLGPDGKIDAKRYPNFAQLAAGSTWYRHATTVYDSTTQAVPAILSGKLPRKGLLPTLSDHPNNIFTLFGSHYRMNVSEEATTLCPERLCHEARGGGYTARMGSLASDLGLVYLHVALPDKLTNKLPSVSQTWGDFSAKSDAGEESEEQTEDTEVTSGSAAAPGDSTAHAAKKPSILDYLAHDRPGRLEQWIANIKPSAKPSLNVKHVLLPHVPFQYLPSGHAYSTSAHEIIPGIASEEGWGDELVVEESRQRHLLQVGYADHELGKLIAHLKANGLWNRALIVVTPDHGMAFHLNQNRRVATASNLQDIAPIPVFIRSPGQRRAVVSDVWLRTVDILPTIASILHVTIPWAHDGAPATSATVRNRRSVMMIKRDFSGRLTLGVGPFQQRVKAAIALKTKLFGSGDAQPGLYGIGPHPQLIGKPLAQLAVRPQSATGPKASLNATGELNAIRLASGYVPSFVTGAIGGDGAGTVHDLAIAVDGSVAAVSHSFYLKGSTTENFAAMVPESVFHDGANTVQVLTVEGSGAATTLTEIGHT
jgi:hypothetical protein